MDFFTAVKTAFVRFRDVRGRSRRAEFWWFWLFNFVLSLPLRWAEHRFEGQAVPTLILVLLYLGFGWIGFALTVRRLHDTDRSGWRILWALTIIGLFPLIYWHIQPGTPGPNRFGPSVDGSEADEPLPEPA